MSYNKKFGLILILSLFLPNILIWLSPVLENYYRGFYINDYKDILLVVAFLSILSPTFVLYKNHTVNNKNRFWYIFGSCIQAVSLIYFYAIYSLSHFGF
jgi:hypothetical protein